MPPFRALRSVGNIRVNAFQTETPSTERAARQRMAAAVVASNTVTEIAKEEGFRPARLASGARAPRQYMILRR
jgi:hypothetical protein